MLYKKFQPISELCSFVDCFFIWEKESKEPLLVQSPPSGFNALIFNYADPYQAYQHENKKVEVPLAFVSGQFTANYHLEMNGKIGIVGAVLKASSIYNIFGLKMTSLVNKRMALQNFLEEKPSGIQNKIKKAGNAEERVQILEDFLKTYLETVTSRLSIIDDTISFIDQNNGMVTIEDVLSKFKISRSYLEKKFLQKVGISPKLYARIRRFSYLSNQIAQNKDINWQDIVFENGYHDQSHLVKDFKAFNHMKPSEYHKGHHELIRFINKK